MKIKNNLPVQNYRKQRTNQKATTHKRLIYFCVIPKPKPADGSVRETETPKKENGCRVSESVSFLSLQFQFQCLSKKA